MKLVKSKKKIAWVLVFLLILGLFAVRLGSMKEQYEGSKKAIDALTWVFPLEANISVNSIGEGGPEGPFLVRDNEKDLVGIKDKEGNWLIPQKYRYIFDYDGQLFLGARVCIGTDKTKEVLWGFLDGKGKEVLPFSYSFAYGFNGDAAAVETDSGWKLIDRQGNIMESTDYESLVPLGENRFIAEKEGYQGIINEKGEVLLPLKYSMIGEGEGLYTVQKIVKGSPQNSIIYNTYEYSYLDESLKPAFSEAFLEGDDFQDGLAAVVTKQGQRGYIDHSGRLVLTIECSSHYNFSEGLARIERGRKTDFIDKTGKTVLSNVENEKNREKIHYISDFQEGLVVICADNGKFGYMDRTGHFVVPPIFDYADSFRHATARVEFSGMSGIFLNPLVKKR